MFTLERRHLREFGVKEVGDLADSADQDLQSAVTARKLELDRQQDRRFRFVGLDEKVMPMCVDCGMPISRAREDFYKRNFSTSRFRAVPLRCATCESRRES